MRLLSIALWILASITVRVVAQTQVALIPADANLSAFKPGMVYPITEIERLHRASPNPVLIPLEGAVHLPMEERKSKVVVFLSAEVPVATPIWDVQLSGEPRPPHAAQSDAEEEFIPVEKEPEFDQQMLMSTIRYPAEAKTAHVEGRVVVEALIGPDGIVERVRIVESDHEILNAAAAVAVALTPFAPAIANGVPSRLWVRIPVQFKLD